MQKIGKEVKIGLAVIGVLVAAFGYILIRRLSRPDDLAAPVASSAPAAATTKPGSSDKPTVVSATDSGRPADSAADGASSSRSLFSSSGRLPQNDSADVSTDRRGSFMPANNVAAANSTPATSDSAASSPAKAADAGHSIYTSGNGPAPASAAGGQPAYSTAGAPPGDPFKSRFADAPPPAAGDSTIHHAGSAAAGAATPATPPIVSQSPLGNSPGDPFQQKSPVADSTAAKTPNASVAAEQSPAAMPAEALPRQQAVAADSTEANPLRGAQDAATGSAYNVATANAATASPAVANPPGSPSQSTAAPSQYSAGDSAPPPITSTAINVQSPNVAPSEPVKPAQPTNAVQPTAADQPVSASQPVAAMPPASASGPAAGSSVSKPGQYVVQADDNYWTISEKVYGTGGYFKAIYEHNRRQHAQSERLQVGDVLDVPEASALGQMYPDLCPKSVSDAQTVSAASAPTPPPGTRIYSVADGDTLYEIARRELGRASRWGEIYQLNHDQLGNDFSYLRAGTQLVIPADASSASVARDPNGSMQR